MEAALVFGGYDPSHAVTESWNGSAWTEVADLNVQKKPTRFRYKQLH